VGEAAARCGGGDLHAAEVEVVDRPAQLLGGQVRVLQRHGGQAEQALRGAPGQVGDLTVDQVDEVAGQHPIGPVVVLRRQHADGLHVDAGGIHRRHPGVQVDQRHQQPARERTGLAAVPVAVDAAAAVHDELGVGHQNVGVHVDDLAHGGLSSQWSGRGSSG
jgi:hypothetical protein